MSILIENAIIQKGDMTPGFKGSLYIEEAWIEKILLPGEDIHPYREKAKRIIDADGLVAAPGFIDTHSHSDLKVLTEPQLKPKLIQGITTEVLGQDGIAMAPLPKAYIGPWRKNLAGLDGDSEDIDWNYETVENYLKMIEEAKPALNELYLLPHGNIRMEAMGLSGREATQEEIEAMCRIIRREMKAGCVGVSSGLIYMPCAYANTREVIEICRVVKEFDGIFVVHQRSEADDILKSMEEILEIGRITGVRLHFSHFKVCGRKNWDKFEGMFRLLEKGEAEGLQISLDQYPYVAGSTMLGVILPPWVHDGGTDRLVERLKSPQMRQQMVSDIRDGIPGWDNFIDFAGVEGIFITSVATKKNQEVVGLSLKQLGEKWHMDPLQAAFDLLLQEENAVGMVDFYGTEDHVVRIMNRPEMNACTDGLMSGKPHPRVYGAFPRILGKYVREEGALTMEAAIHKMTYKAAKTFGLRNRGLLETGYFADITLFDPDRIMDRGDFVNPLQEPEGIEYVLVNGHIALEKGRLKSHRHGRVIRFDRSSRNIGYIE